MKRILSLLLVLLTFSSAISASAYVYDDDYVEEPIVEISGGYMYLANVEDLSPYENKEKITEVCLKNCTIGKDSKILSNDKLKDVRLINCSFEEGSWTFGKNVKTIQIERNIPDEVIKKIGNVDELTFWEYTGKDLTPFSVLGNIKCLSIAESTVSSLKGIEKLTSLEDLTLSNVGVQSIEELKYLKNLKYLSITGSFVEDLSPLENLKLDTLDVDDNYSLKSLDSVMKISTLKTLWAHNSEMAYTKKLVDFVTKNKIDSDVSAKGLEVQKKVKALAGKLVNDGMSDEEKIGTIVKYVCDNMEYTLPEDTGDEYTYDYEYNNLLEKYNDEALGYALKGIGCCANYAALTHALLEQAGIESFCVEGQNHIWNLVKTDGYYYWIDSTWIDTSFYSTLDESIWYMDNSDLFLERHPYYTIPTELYENPDAFGRDYTHTMTFELADWEWGEDEEPKTEKPTKAEKTTEETTAQEKTTVEEKTTAEEKSEETTKENVKENDDNGKNKKVVVIVIVSAAALAVVTVAVVVVMKKRNKPVV